jgi:hypothetical protein
MGTYGTRGTCDAKADGRGALENGLLGVPGGGFTSVGTDFILLTAGKWYYEVELMSNSCIQMGWADSSFVGNSSGGDGGGDNGSSWAFDGWRCYKWHETSVEWGCKWKIGDIVGVGVDFDTNSVSFWLNGLGEEVGVRVYLVLGTLSLHDDGCAECLHGGAV